MIQITAAAQTEILRLSRRANLSDSQVHLGIRAGGCCGQIYTLDIRARSPEYPPEDFRTEPPGMDQSAQVFVSPSALPYLEQLTLDYSEDLMGGNFRFVNPTATQTCSCGQSFAMGLPSVQTV